MRRLGLRERMRFGELGDTVDYGLDGSGSEGKGVGVPYY